MGCWTVVRMGGILVVSVAVLIGALLADVPGQLGFWRYLDSVPGFKGSIPLLHPQKEWKFNHSTLSPTALNGRVFVVTGANVGLGYGSVHYLAAHGGRVILGCRSMKNCEEAVIKVKREISGADLVPLVLDLSSFASVKKFAQGVRENTNEVHSMILNAGIAACPYSLTEDGIEYAIGVNHFGHAYLVRLLGDVLKRTATPQLPGTIVAVSSAAHYSSYPEGLRLSLAAINNQSTFEPWLAYGQSKLANIMYAQELAVRLKPFNILVNSLHPGAVDTNAFANIIERFHEGFPWVYDMLVKSGITKHIGELFTSLAWSVKDGALTQVYLAASPEVLSNRVTGKYFTPVARETLPAPKYLSNSSLQKQFWEFTEDVIQLKSK